MRTYAYTVYCARIYHTQVDVPILFSTGESALVTFSGEGLDPDTLPPPDTHITHTPQVQVYMYMLHMCSTMYVCYRITQFPPVIHP